MKENFQVIINRLSGTVLRLGEDKVKSMLEDAFGHRMLSLHMVEAKDLCSAIDALGHGEDTDLLIGGGDGTAVCAAAHLMGRGVHFGMLPLGTMNLLAQDLGSAATFEETMARFKDMREDKIDLGTVNDKFFLCSAVIGLVPESAIAREEIRDEQASTINALAKFVGTIARGMGGIDKQSLDLRLGDEEAPFPLETTSLIISNNRFVRNPGASAERFLRETLKAGKLAVYSAAPQDMMGGMRLLFKMVQGSWQEDDAIFSFETPSLIVAAPQDKLLISLDGEPLEMTLPLHFTIRSKALPVLRMELAS